MIGELREALTVAVQPAMAVAGRCAACGAENPGPVGGTCRVCGGVLRAGVKVTPSAPTISDIKGPNPSDPDDLVASELNESIVSFARKRWTETLHPRDPGGLGGGQFTSKPGGGAPRPSAPRRPQVATSRRPHLEHGGRAAKTAQRPTPIDRAPRAQRGKLAGEAPKLSEAELPTAVGVGAWSAAVPDTVAKMRSGQIADAETYFKQQGKGPYPPERVELHARIANLLLQGSQAHASPEAVFLAGGPASGKSSVVKSGQAKLAKDAVDVNPDIVKSMLPEYQALVAAGDKRAAAIMHEESSHISKLVMNLALLRKHNITVDGVGNSGPGKFSGKMQAALNAGHRVRAVYVTIDTDEAVRRAEQRAQRSGRHVAEGFIRASHASVSRAYLDDVAKLGIPISIYDNGGKAGSGAKLIAEHSRNGNLTVLRRSLYDAFVEKADPSIGEGRAKLKAQKDAIKSLRREFGGDVGDQVVLGEPVRR
jgi:predicted ABC-type ATPase